MTRTPPPLRWWEYVTRKNKFVQKILNRLLERGIFVEIMKLLIVAKNHKASDLHLNVGTKPKIRKNGSLIDVEETYNLTSEDVESMACSILSDNNKSILLSSGDVDFAYDMDGFRLRVNISKERQGFFIAIRILSKEIPTLEGLNMPKVINQLASLKRGLVLITGATGSGKSTTLAAIVDYINTTRKEHIITIEDPIEYIHTHKNCIVSQREVGRDAGSFEKALKSSLRQDPDIILLGEMRDLQTTQAALTAAETGHLVFSTLHTNGAIDSINRIIDIFPHEAKEQVKSQLSSTLQGVVTQRLVKKEDNSGRVAALEIMIVNQGIKNLIREGKSHQINQVIQTNISAGMQGMDYHLAQLHKSRTISLLEANSNCSNPDTLKHLL